MPPSTLRGDAETERHDVRHDGLTAQPAFQSRNAWTEPFALLDGDLFLREHAGESDRLAHLFDVGGASVADARCASNRARSSGDRAPSR